MSSGVGKPGKHVPQAEHLGGSRTAGQGQKFSDNIISQPFMHMSGQDAGGGSVTRNKEHNGNTKSSTAGATRSHDGIGSKGGRH